MLKTRNGKLLLLNGKLMTGPAGVCCCENDEPVPTCCYNDQCQVVPCLNSQDQPNPDVIGSVIGCDPCELNFCGFCPPGLATEVPPEINETMFVPTPGTGLIEYDFCQYVPLQGLRIEYDIEGTISAGDTNNIDSIINYLGCVEVRTAFTYGNSFGAGTNSWTMRQQILVLGQPVQPNLILNGGEVYDGTIDGWTFRLTARAEVSQLVNGALDRNRCERTLQYLAELEYEIEVLDENGNVPTPLTLPSVLSGSDSRQVSSVCDLSSNCGAGEILTSRRMTGQSISSGSTVEHDLQVAPYVNALPVCTS